MGAGRDTAGRDSRRSGQGGNDLWVSRRTINGWQAPTAVTELNTRGTDADPYVSPDERYMIYCSDRPGGVGEGDLYVSFRREGRWTAPVSLGPAINTSTYEYTPWVTADGRWLYFSRGWGEIWRVEVAQVAHAVDDAFTLPTRALAPIGVLRPGERIAAGIALPMPE